MMVHFGILTSLQHISGWEKDCVTAVFNEELLSQSTTTLSGVDSWLLLPNRTRALHGYSTRGFAAQISSIRPPEREQALPLETARRADDAGADRGRNFCTAALSRCADLTENERSFLAPTRGR